MKKHNRAFTVRLLTMTVLLLFVTNAVISLILLHNSRIGAKKLINERMLDIANCASAFIDGDTLKSLTANSVGSPEYMQIYNTLSVFLNNINKDQLKYIYCAYKGDDEEFYFAADPADDASAFGTKIKYSDGMKDAVKGIPSVDEKPYTDSWGSFYSAYSPVYDSTGEIVGVVMVDFDANWYGRQIMSEMGIIIVVCVLSLIVNGIAVFAATDKLRHNMLRLQTELDILSDDISDLTNDKSEGGDDPDGKNSHEDEISKTIYRTRYLQSKVRAYISHMKSQAFCDAMTGVGNRTAFNDLTEELNKKIAAGKADFSIAVFDINGLKYINDESGHTQGDSIIIDAAFVLKDVFGAENIFRIGGDEFIAITEHTTYDDMMKLFDMLDGGIEEINKHPERQAAPLYISKGAVTYTEGLDYHFNDMFKRADEIMYKDKADFYVRRGEQRRKN